MSREIIYSFGERAIIACIWSLTALVVVLWVINPDQSSRSYEAILQNYNQDFLEWSPEAEVAQIVKNKREIARYIVKISPQLHKEIEQRPMYVLICLAVAQAKNNPKITDQEAERVMSFARNDIDQGLCELRAVLEAASVREMKRVGFDLKIYNRKAFDDGVPAIRLVLSDLPLAIKLKKERQLAIKSLESYDYGGKNWWEPEFSHKQYIMRR